MTLMVPVLVAAAVIVVTFSVAFLAGAWWVMGRDR